VNSSTSAFQRFAIAMISGDVGSTFAAIALRTFGMISFHESRTSFMCASVIEVRRSRSTSSCSVVKYFSIAIVT